MEILTPVNQLAKDMKWREPLVVVPTRKPGQADSLANLAEILSGSGSRFAVAEGKWNVKETHSIVIATAFVQRDAERA